MTKLKKIKLYLFLHKTLNSLSNCEIKLIY